MSESFVEQKIQECAGGDVAFDIGANEANYAILLSEKFKRVFAFEPEPINLTKLEGKHAAKQLPDNISIEKYAISNQSGTCKLYTQVEGLVTGHSIAEKMIVHPLWALDVNRYVEVPCITIDDFCQQRSLVPSFIKMDIEGGEDFVWEGAVKTLKENKISIVLELHHVDIPKLTKFFNNLGYTITPDGQIGGDSSHIFLQN